MNISGLSNDCILAILAHLPAPDLLHHAQFVCTRWNQLVPVVSKSLSKLTLAFGIGNRFAYYGILDTDFSDYLADYRDPNCPERKRWLPFWFTDPNVTRLLNTFPKVTQLVIIANYISGSQIATFETLLRKYGSRLVSLKLWIRYENWDGQHAKIAELCAIINQMVKLTHLTVSLRNCIYPQEVVQAPFPIHLPGLKQLNWSTWDHKYRSMYRSLVHYLTSVNSQIEQVGLGYWISSSRKLAQLMQLADDDQQLAAKFRYMNINAETIQSADLHRFFSRFSQLPALQIIAGASFNMAILTTALAPLVQLNFLGIFVQFKSESDPTQITALRSVKRVRIKIFSPVQLEQLYMHLAFPGLEELLIDSGSLSPNPTLSTREQVRQSIKPLSKFANLQLRIAISYADLDGRFVFDVREL